MASVKHFAIIIISISKGLNVLLYYLPLYEAYSVKLLLKGHRDHNGSRLRKHSCAVCAQEPLLHILLMKRN